jgi:hypothetical protein
MRLVLTRCTVCVPHTGHLFPLGIYIPACPAQRGRRFLLDQAKAVGPEGGCVGIEQWVAVALAGCCTCPTEESP